MGRVDSLNQGSWNGVIFQYQDAGWADGQRGQLHQYPDSDRFFYEGLGSQATQYTLDIFAVGDDWNAQRAALRAAFAANHGKGTLVHPTDGRMAARALDVKTQENVDQLGKVMLSVTIIPDNTPAAAATPDTGSGVAAAAGNTATASQASAGNAFSYVGQSYEVQSATQSALGTVLGAIGGAVGFATNLVGGALSWFSYGVSAAGAVERQVLNDVAFVSGINPSIDQQTVSWAADLATTIAAGELLGAYPDLPAQIWVLIQGISGLQPTGSGVPFSSWTQQRRVGVQTTVMRPASVTDASAGYVPVTTGGYSGDTIRGIFLQQLSLATALARPTPPRAQPAQATTNINALYDTARQAALSEAAGAFSAVPFATRTDAFAMRDLVAGALDAEANLVADGTVRTALSQLRLAVVADAKARSLGLPSVKSIEIAQPVPAIVLAQQLYDDPGMAADLLRRNAVGNPLFMPAGVALEVIANG